MKHCLSLFDILHAYLSFTNTGQILITVAALCLVKPSSLGNYLANSIYITPTRKGSNNGLNVHVASREHDVTLRFVWE